MSCVAPLAGFICVNWKARIVPALLGNQLFPIEQSVESECQRRAGGRQLGRHHEQHHQPLRRQSPAS